MSVFFQNNFPSLSTLKFILIWDTVFTHIRPSLQQYLHSNNARTIMYCDIWPYVLWPLALCSVAFEWKALKKSNTHSFKQLTVSKVKVTLV